MYQQKGRTSWHGSQPGMMMSFHGSSVPLGTCWLFSILIATNHSLGSCNKNKDSQQQNQTYSECARWVGCRWINRLSGAPRCPTACPPRTETFCNVKRGMENDTCISTRLLSMHYETYYEYELSWSWSLSFLIALPIFTPKRFQSPITSNHYMGGTQQLTNRSLDSLGTPMVPPHVTMGTHGATLAVSLAGATTTDRSSRCLSKESVPQMWLENGDMPQPTSSNPRNHHNDNIYIYIHIILFYSIIIK